MSSPEYYQKRIADLKKEQGKLEQEKSKYEVDAAKKRSEAQRKRKSATSTSSATSQQSYLRDATRLDEQAAALAKKAADVASKLGTNADKQRQESGRLASAEKTVARARERDDQRRQQREKAHAREVARLAQPVTRHVYEVREVPAPQPESLRVVYLTASPRPVSPTEEPGEFEVTHLRVDAEVRAVREEVKRSVYRDQIDIDHWPAATPMDLLKGLNDKRPHLVHFSGHGGVQSLEFDNADVEHPEGLVVSFDKLAKALSATDTPPRVLVLNACDTLEGAEVLLEAVPVVIATATAISDLAAQVFAVQFYSAVASGQSVRAALDQARAAIDFMPSGDGDVIRSLAREGENLAELILVKPV